MRSFKQEVTAKYDLDVGLVLHHNGGAELHLREGTIVGYDSRAKGVTVAMMGKVRTFPNYSEYPLATDHLIQFQ